MGLCLPRKDLIADQEKTFDERLYNNFKLARPDTTHTSDISKKVGRRSSLGCGSHGS